MKKSTIAWFVSLILVFNILLVPAVVVTPFALMILPENPVYQKVSLAYTEFCSPYDAEWLMDKPVGEVMEEYGTFSNMAVLPKEEYVYVVCYPIKFTSQRLALYMTGDPEISTEVRVKKVAFVEDDRYPWRIYTPPAETAQPAN